MSDARLLTLHSVHLSMLLFLLTWLPPGPAGSAAPPTPRADGHPRAAPLHDCNGNGIEDMVDIAQGTSSDADLDGVPDECQARSSANPEPLPAPGAAASRH